MNFYITADKVGIQSGGGQVTHQEELALQEFGSTTTVSIDHEKVYDTPFDQDVYIRDKLKSIIGGDDHCQKGIAHAYAGCLTETMKYLKSVGWKTTYTTAAHSVQESRRAHEEIGVEFPYPHLTEPHLWQQYLQGYLEADVLIVPSTHSKKVKEGYGRKGPIEIIPHGVHVPENVERLPNQFICGYLGAIGPDKGLIYLVKAWKEINRKWPDKYRNSRLMIAGQHTDSQYVRKMIMEHGGGNISLLGWVQHPSNFYNQVSLYIQPSVTEGFGMEVTEAMAYGRPVLCSIGAGAHDFVSEGWKFKPKDVEEMVYKIDLVHDIIYVSNRHLNWSKLCRERVTDISWPKIRERYKDVWRRLL